MQETPEQPLKRGLFLPPLLQALISGTGLLVAVLMVILFFLSGFVNLFTGSASEDLLPAFSLAWSALLVAVLLLPSVVRSIRHLAGKPQQARERNLFPLALIGMLLWAPLVLLGHWLAGQPTLHWLWLPPLQVLAVALPIFFWVEAGRRRLREDPEESSHGVYGFGVVVTQPLVIVVEIILLVGLVVLFLLWASVQPDLLAELTRLGQRMMDAQMDPMLLESILLPYLQSPWLIYLSLMVGAGLIPLVEELLKPLALWLMVGRKLNESQGFMMGLVAGGTFALLESLSIASAAAPQEWSSIMVARLGTGILHVTTSALVGWGLGAAWAQRRYLQLGLAFLLAVSLHGIWNFFGLLLGIVPFLPDVVALPGLELVGPLALGVLSAVMLLIIFNGNQRLRRQQV